jgi:hypothetical protein
VKISATATDYLDSFVCSSTQASNEYGIVGCEGKIIWRQKSPYILDP